MDKTKSVGQDMDLDKFVDKLMEEKNFPSDLDKEVLAEIKNDLLNQVEERINAVIISNLPEDKLTEFNELLDKNISDEEMQKFCSDNIPDLSQLIASELIVFRESYLS